MEKPAQTQHPILDLLQRRWSPRSFSDRPIEAQKIRRLFEAARWAASSFNEQPWRFLIATRDDEQAFEQVLECMVEANRAWAKSAPLVGLTVAKEAFSKNEKPNRVCDHDVGLAMGNLSIQATAMDLFVHQMAGIEPGKARESFGIPEGFHAFTGFAVGYEGDPGALPEEWMREAETATRQRKAFDEFVFSGGFDKPSSIFKE